MTGSLQLNDILILYLEVPCRHLIYIYVKFALLDLFFKKEQEKKGNLGVYMFHSV